MEFSLNGKRMKYAGDENLSLLKFLRNEQGITSVKDGCSGQGACGACAVQMNDRAVFSCVTPMKWVRDTKIITTEGLTFTAREALAFAFSRKGGVQCGFCTPGIVISAKILLEKNPDPTPEQVKGAINKHLCRCTGYKKIIDSILFAGKIFRGEEQIRRIDHSGEVGTRLPKYDAVDTVLGERPFVCDLDVLNHNLHHGAMKFSDHPRAKVVSIDCSHARKSEGVVAVITAEDVPGKRYIGLIENDWPLMIKVGEVTRYIGDVIAGVVAKTEEQARTAVSKIKVKYQVYDPITTVDKALKTKACKVHPGKKNNVLSVSSLLHGDPDRALVEAAFVVSGTYYTQRVEHAFLEKECCLAVPEVENEGIALTVYSQTQGAYEDRKQISRLLDLNHFRVNVIQVQNGGGFGGKEDMTVQGHASVYAHHCKVPVKVELTREESMMMHPKRHPMRLRYTLGCDESGMLTVLRCRIDGDTGAYASVGMKVLERAAGHATGGYEVPNIDLVATAVYTNNVPCGAMRGFGVNQVTFAMEGCIDALCEKGGFDRWELRYKNALDEGKHTATGQVLNGGIGLKKTLLALKDKFYAAKYAGIACGIKNTGIGNGVADVARAKIVVENSDRIVIHHGWTEMGQGVHTVAIQTVCQETGLSPDIMEVRVETREDTACGMTTSSRGTSMVGNSLIEACKEFKIDLKTKKLKDLKGKEYRGEWVCDWTTDSFCDNPLPGPVTHYSYGYATQLVTLNDSGTIEKIYAAHDVGKIMNPTLFEGQIEGALHMGLGYALSENFPMEDGRPLINRFGKLGMVRAKQMPELEVIGIEDEDPVGPYGAKGVGEIGMVPTAAAVANALYQFDGIRRYSLPIGVSKTSC